MDVHLLRDMTASYARMIENGENIEVSNKGLIYYIYQSPAHLAIYVVLVKNSKMKLVDRPIYWGIHNLNSVIISRFLGILASQNRFESSHDKLFNVERFLAS